MLKSHLPLFLFWLWNQRFLQETPIPLNGQSQLCVKTVGLGGPVAAKMPLILGSKDRDGTPECVCAQFVCLSVCSPSASGPEWPKQGPYTNLSNSDSIPVLQAPLSLYLFLFPQQGKQTKNQCCSPPPFLLMALELPLSQLQRTKTQL